MIARLLARLRADCDGAALVEFALALPALMIAGGGAIECANLALAVQQVNQTAINLADNASRVGLLTALSTTQLRETDINDALTGTRIQGSGLGLTTYGRITLSSLENIRQTYDSAAVQRIHWQRCIGLASGTGYDSSYGTTTVTAGTDATQSNAGTAASSGMGDAGSMVGAPAGYAAMFVEINYTYQPLFGTMFIAPRRIHATASLLVRDNRDFAQVYNPSPTATRATCDLHAA